MTENFYISFKNPNYHRSAKNMVLDMVRFSDHSHNKTGLETQSAVVRYLATFHLDFDQVIERVRDYTKYVPLFENRFGYTVKTIGTPKVEAIDKDLGQVAEVKGPGSISRLAYASQFEHAIQLRNEAMRQFDISRMTTAIVEGISSIEGYITYKAAIWNKTHLNKQLLDSSDRKASFVDKIDIWIPQMANGKKFDKGTRIWDSYIKLSTIRSNENIHPKHAGFGISANTFVKHVNLFRDGISQFLLILHKHCSDTNIPSIIIRAAYAPDAIMVTN